MSREFQKCCKRNIFLERSAEITEDSDSRQRRKRIQPLKVIYGTRSLSNRAFRQVNISLLVIEVVLQASIRNHDLHKDRDHDQDPYPDLSFGEKNNGWCFQ